MRIGIDVRALQESHRFRGIGIYLTNLLRALDQGALQNEFFLYQWPGASVANELRLSGRFQIRLLPEPLRKPIFRRIKNELWRDIRVRAGDLDIFVQPDPSYGRPDGPVTTVGILYDLIPTIFHDRYFPSLFQSARLKLQPKQLATRKIDQRLYYLQLRDLTKSDAIIAISACTKNDFLKNFSEVPSNRVSVIPLACNPRLRRVQNVKRTLRRLGISSSYILYVGGIDFRKNVGALLDSYKNLLARGHKPRLVLAGNDFDPKTEILEARQLLSQYQDMISRGDIVRLGFLSLGELAALYSGATALVSPSLYEGFGLTVLEAMSCGCPVIAYDNSSIREVGGNAALMLRSEDDLSDAMDRVCSSARLRQDLQKRGLSQSKKFSWEKTARQTLALLERVAG